MFALEDDPQVMFAGAQVSDPRYLYADRQGSVVAIADANGSVTHIDAYDDYGVPEAGNVGRFGYTGQAWLPELGMELSAEYDGAGAMVARYVHGEGEDDPHIAAQRRTGMKRDALRLHGLHRVPVGL